MPSFFEDIEIHQSRVRAYLSKSQTLTANMDSKIALDVKDYDTLDEFDNTTNYRFTAKRTGFYLVTANVQFEDLNPDDWYVAYILKNIDIIVWSEGNAGHSVGIANYSLTLSTIVYLAKDDYLELWALRSSDGVVSGEDPYFTFMAVHILSER
jgi:hypothetical protein